MHVRVHALLPRTSHSKITHSYAHIDIFVLFVEGSQKHSSDPSPIAPSLVSRAEPQPCLRPALSLAAAYGLRFQPPPWLRQPSRRQPHCPQPRLKQLPRRQPHCPQPRNIDLHARVSTSLFHTSQWTRPRRTDLDMDLDNIGPYIDLYARVSISLFHTNATTLTMGTHAMQTGPHGTDELEHARTRTRPPGTDGSGHGRGQH